MIRLLLTSIRFTVLCVGAAALLSACGSGGRAPPQSIPLDTRTPSGPTLPPPAGAIVTVTGTISFQRFGFKQAPLSGLDVGNPVASAARGIVVEALDGDTAAVLASTNTDTDGFYSLAVPANTNIRISAKAQMLKTGAAPTWNFRVLNNTNSDALYVLQSAAFNSGTVATISGRNLLATTGFNGTMYTGPRAAAPFAILDTIFQAQQLVLSASANARFPPLDLFWSPNNRTAGPLCPDLGNITTSFYVNAGGFDSCNMFQGQQSQPLPEGIYILGDFGNGNGDTDEFDQSVIAHEFGHFFEEKFSRSDSLGGPHGQADRLDLRVAFSEGFGNAFSAMTLNNPLYRDSQSGVGGEFNFNLESGDMINEGWYSEISVGEILWDLFDDVSAPEPADTVALGFAPIFDVLTNGHRTTDALTSIFSFLKELRASSSVNTGAIDQLRINEEISGLDEFGAGETNDGGDPDVLPVYKPIVLNQRPQSVCVNAANGRFNKLATGKFFQLMLSNAAIVTITATGSVDPGMPRSVAALDPDITVHRRGDIVLVGHSNGASESILQQPLPAGAYIVEVMAVELLDPMLGPDATPRCMTLSVAGA